MGSNLKHLAIPTLEWREKLSVEARNEKSGAPKCVGIVNLAIPAHGGRPGAYSYSPRSDEPRARDLRGSTLRTGYCDRKIDETD